MSQINSKKSLVTLLSNNVSFKSIIRSSRKDEVSWIETTTVGLLSASSKNSNTLNNRSSKNRKTGNVPGPTK